MRLPADEQLALDTVLAASDAGITVFDTAHAYGAERAGLGDNERLVARALRAAGWQGSARIVTKGAMTRPGGAWVPDGRAKAIAADCEASLVALDGLPIDLYLIHAPDPRTVWRTSVRSLARLVDQELVQRVGVANVTRGQLDEAVELAPIAAVQVALSPLDDRALRGGVVARCTELGLTLIAHSPLGGPRRAGTLARRRELTQIAARYDVTWAEAALAWVLGTSPNVVAIPGARRPESVRSAARAAGLELSQCPHLGGRQHQPRLPSSCGADLFGGGKRVEPLQQPPDEVDLRLSERRVEPHAPHRERASLGRLDHVAAGRTRQIGVVEYRAANAGRELLVELAG